MANISGTYYSSSSYYPKFTYSISYSEIGRSSSSVSYRFYVSYSRTSDRYGYDIQVNWNIGGATGSKQILAANANSASGSISFDVSCSTNASGGTLSARIYTSSNTDGTHWQNAIDTGSQTVSKSTFNTAPTMTDTFVSTNPSGTFSEKTATLTPNWAAASDTNGNLSGYRIRVSINGGTYSELARVGASTRTYAHNISSYGEGTTFRYIVDAYDSYNEWSGNAYSDTVKKNVFTMDTLASSSSITFNSSSISFTFSGGSNTQSGVSITRALTCSGITVYNASNVSSPISLTIYKSGTVPTTPYIKFSDLKSKFANTTNKGIGTLTFTLTGTNSNGTVKTSTKNISVNLQSAPNAVSNQQINLTNSTNYIAVKNGNKYIIPDGTKLTNVQWSAAVGALGEAVKYQIYVAYGSGGWSKLADLATGTTSYNHAVPTQTVSQQIKYMIRSISTYADTLTKDATTAAQTLHYYNAPGLTEGSKTRQSTTATAEITVKTNTSISLPGTVGTWTLRQEGTTTTLSSGNINSTAQDKQTISVSGLTEANKYEIVISYNDNTGLTATNKSHIVKIGVFAPVFHINKYGVGVNGAVATSSNRLNVSGNTNISGVLNTSGNINSSASITAANLYATGSDKNVRMYVPNASYAWITTDATSGLYVNNNLSVKGEIYAGSSYSNRVYHTGYKPTPADIGAAASSHTHSYLPLTGGTVTGNTNFTGGLQAGGRNVISSASANSGWYIRYHDGTQICWGFKSYGAIAMTDNPAGAVWTNVGKGLNGFTITFAANFTSEPYVMAVGKSNAYTCAQCYMATTSTGYFRLWNPYSSNPDTMKLEYIAIGRWY